jgi:hypothetical protein
MIVTGEPERAITSPLALPTTQEKSPQLREMESLLTLCQPLSFQLGWDQPNLTVALDWFTKQDYVVHLPSKGGDLEFT